MDFKNFNRRNFIKGSLSTLALASLPGRIAFSQTTIRNRLEWNDFKNSADYSSFVNAIRTMRANTNSSDRRSWIYWTNIHINSCPHSIAYFLLWHRGYLHYFQQVLREISGNSTLMLPYWDYYKNPVIPPEFTDPSADNPLYVTGRVNTNVYQALSLTPFSIRYRNFQRGTTDAFEPTVEYRPHNALHNVIGGYMARMNSPMDPIFWLHHGEIDRLWAAWVAADNGRQMPPIADPYWAGNLTYRSDLTMPRNQTFDTQTFLGYDYQDKALPTSLPPQAQSARIIRVQMQLSPGRTLRRPPVGNYPLLGPSSIGNNRRSIGGARTIPLDENSTSVQIPVEESDRQALESTIEGTQTSPFSRGRSTTGQYTSVQVVVENARIEQGADDGGYFYDVYLNLPENSYSVDAEQYRLGGFGPFEITSAQHHPGSSRLVFPATKVLQMFSSEQLRELTVSFVRVSGNNSPKGQVIVVGALRIELSTDPVE